MKILIISGSPRKGNSEAIALKFKEILEKIAAHAKKEGMEFSIKEK